MSGRNGVVYNKTVRETARMLNNVLTCYPSGLLCFFGPEENYPSYGELMEVFIVGSGGGECGPVDGGIKVPEAEKAVEIADEIRCLVDKNGGYHVFAEVFAEFKRCCPYETRLLCEISLVGSLQFPSFESVAVKNHVSKRHLYRLKNKALLQLANEIYLKSRDSYMSF